MNATTAPNHLSIAAQLPAGAHYYLMHTLRGTLPRLLTNTPENRARRDEAAMARVAALCPANIAEAEVAALHVANAEHAKACLFDAQQPTISLLGVLKCRAQAASMSRQADSSLRMLLRMQAARQKMEANPEARDRAAWTEHCALNLMAQALSSPPAPATIPEPPSPPPPPASRQPNPHLSRTAGEVGSRSEPGDGAAGKAKEPQPAVNSTQPESAPVRQPQLALVAANQDTPVSPKTDAPIRPTDRFADLPDDDLMQAILTAFRPASVT